MTNWTKTKTLCKRIASHPFFLPRLSPLKRLAVCGQLPALKGGSRLHNKWGNLLMDGLCAGRVRGSRREANGGQVSHFSSQRQALLCDKMIRQSFLFQVYHAQDPLLPTRCIVPQLKSLWRTICTHSVIWHYSSATGNILNIIAPHGSWLATRKTDQNAFTTNL